MYRTMILVSRNIRQAYIHADIRGGSSGRRRQTIVGLSTTTFYVSLDTSSETLERRSVLSIGADFS